MPEGRQVSPGGSFRSARSRTGGFLAVALAVAVAVILAVTAVRRPPPPQEASPPPVPPGAFRPTPGQWSNLTFAAVKNTEFSPFVDTDGEVAANDDRTTQVFSPYTGQITRIFVTAGQEVKKGEPLYSIRASEFVQGQSDLVAALGQLRIAEANEARQSTLYKVDGAALKDWQQSQADLANAQANLEAVKGRLRILGKSNDQIAALEHAPAGGGQADTVVPAPISGEVMIKQAGIGQYIDSAASGATTALFTISDLSTVWLVANVREADVQFIRLGAPLQVRLLAFPDRIFEGRVRYISAVDPTTRRIAVRAEIENPGGLLKPQMFAEASVSTGPARMELAVPEDAVIHEADTTRVWVAQPGSKTVALRQIKVGDERSGMVEVLSGLAPGEQVVNGGALFIDREARGD